MSARDAVEARMRSKVSTDTPSPDGLDDLLTGAPNFDPMPVERESSYWTRDLHAEPEPAEDEPE